MWDVYDWKILASQMQEWTLIDGELCTLVGRLRKTGYRHTLEAELRLTEARDDPGDFNFARFLPKFRRQGIVTIIQNFWGPRLLHSSTGNRGS